MCTAGTPQPLFGEGGLEGTGEDICVGAGLKYNPQYFPVLVYDLVNTVYMRAGAVFDMHRSSMDEMVMLLACESTTFGPFSM